MNKEELKRESIKIRESFKAFKLDLENQYRETLIKQAETTKVFKAAAAKGDIRENAEYSTAEKELTMCNTILANLNSQLKNISLVKEEEYYPMDMVVMYSTVFIRNDLGQEFIFQVYPDGVSDLSRRILSVASPIGTGLWLKLKGQSFSLEHRIRRNPIKWTVVEVY